MASLMSAPLMSAPLLVSITSTGNGSYIVIFDVSGSTIVNKKDGLFVINIMANTLFTRLLSMGVKFFNCIFFGSKNPNKMPEGYIIDEGIFTTDNVKSFTEIAQSHADRYNLTCPNFAIDNIPTTWLKVKRETDFKEVLIVGDGELFAGPDSVQLVRRNFTTSIKSFLDKNPLVRISFLAVDVMHTFGAENMAGMDMYDALREAKLTDRVSNFTMYSSLTDSRELINNKCVPAGYIGYRSQMFIASRENDFFGVIGQEIIDCHTIKVYDIVRFASASVASIIRSNGVSPVITENIIMSYANLFKNFTSDGVDDIICEDLISSFSRSVNNILRNQADLSTSFYTDRKKFFEEANAIMASSVKNAIGFTSEKGISFPLSDNKIYHVSMCEVTSPLSPTMPYACFKDTNGTTTPIIPDIRRVGKMTNQCMRQSVRAYMASMFGFSVPSEHAKFAPLVFMVMAYFSEIPIETKRNYIETGICMLQKTLTGIDITEIDNLRKGNTHSVRTWTNDLQEVINKLTGTHVPALAVWYVMCRIIDEHVGDNILSKNQYTHVNKVVIDPNHWQSLVSSFPKLTQVEVPCNYYEFICPITHDDTSAGGYYIKPHDWNGNSSSGRRCNTNMVISAEQFLMDIMVKDNHFSCVVCRARLHKNNMEFIKKSEHTIILPTKQLSIQITAVPENANFKCGVIVLYGPVGAGKTTITKKIREALAGKGRIYVANTDAHCVDLIKKGANPKSVTGQACKIVTAELSAFVRLPGDKFVIVDTCGERHKDGNIFNVNMPTDIWKYVKFPVNVNPATISRAMLNNYFGWCLSHVITRTESGMGEYWLNPESAGFDICMKVLIDKANGLYPGKCQLPKYSNKAQAIEAIAPMVAEYDAYLEKTYNQSAEIDKCIAQFM